MNCNDNALFDSQISEDAWSIVLCSCAWVYAGSSQERRGPAVWVLGPGRNDPLKSTETAPEGSRMQAASSSYRMSDLWAQTLCPGQGMCVCPHSHSYRNCSHLHREALHLSHRMDRNMTEMHRTAAARPGDSVQSCDGTVPAPPAEPGCLSLPALHIDTDILRPSRIWELPYHK